MRRLSIVKVIVSANILLFAGDVSAETTFRIATWNIANFHHEAGVELRESIGTKRLDADFLALKRYADGLDADIIALQEIGKNFTRGGERH
jgi:hypothetical protein